MRLIRSVRPGISSPVNVQMPAYLRPSTCWRAMMRPSSCAGYRTVPQVVSAIWAWPSISLNLRGRPHRKPCVLVPPDGEDPAGAQYHCHGAGCVRLFRSSTNLWVVFWSERQSVYRRWPPDIPRNCCAPCLRAASPWAQTAWHPTTSSSICRKC